MVSSVAKWGKYFFTLLCIGAVTILFSCNEPDELGLGLLPASAELDVFTTDTITIVAHAKEGDSLPTNRGFLGYILGSYTDPVFGRTDASFYGQLGLSSTPELGDSGEILTADSLVLALEFLSPLISETVNHYYGNLNTPLKVTVYRLTEAMSLDSSYFSNQTLATESQPIGSGTFIPAPNDSVTINGVKAVPQLRIKLSNQLAADLLAQNNTDVFENTANWLEYFKGVYVKTEPVNGINQGSVSQFYLGGSVSSMWLYFHSDTPGDDSLKFNFPFNLARIHHFEHSDASFEAGRQVQDSTYNDSITYLQSMGGVRAKIEMPYLADLKALGPLVVNKAELVIPVQDLTTEVYSPPAKLNLVAILANGSTESLVDYTNESLYFGGTYDATNKLYKFNIARHLQSILDGSRTDYGLYVTVPYIVGASGFANIQPNRVIFTSGKNATRPVYLNLSFTILD